MIELMVGRYKKPEPGLKGSIIGRTQKTITGNGMKMSTSGAYLASGYATANGGTGEVYISDLRQLHAPVIKRLIRLPEWKPGTASGFSRAGQIVRGSDDLRTVVTNTSPDGVDKGALYVMNLDADHNVLDSSKLYPVGAGSGDYFGVYFDVAGNGQSLVVGSYGASSFAGRVHIYSKNSGVWSIEKLITKPAVDTGTRFGTGVSISTDGEWVAISSLPTAAAGSSKVHLYKKNGGAWDHWTVLGDTRNISSPGRLTGYLSGDGTKLFVTFSYNTLTAGSPDGGVDVYDINQTTGALTLISTVTNGVAGGGYGIQPYVNFNGSVFMASPYIPNGNQYHGAQCIQLNPTTGQYEKSWELYQDAFAGYPVYPAFNDDATIWAAAVPNLIGQAQDSFFCGR